MVVRPDPEQEVSKGGIIMAQTYKERPSSGKVIGIGKKVVEVKKGDHVVFSKWAGTCVDPDDKEILLMKEDDILASIT